LNSLEGFNNFPARVDTQSVADNKMGNRVDVATDGASAEFECFTNRRSASHEGIEYHCTGQSHRLVKHLQYIRSLRGEGSEQNSAEDRPKPLRPPFVNMIDRTVNLFAPAFQLGNIAQVFEREASIFYGSCAPKGEYRPTIGSRWLSKATSKSTTEGFNRTSW